MAHLDRLHVIVASHALPEHRAGGLERAAAAVIGGLAGRGHRLTVLTTGLADGSAPTWPRASRGESDGDADRVRLETLPGRSGHPSPAFWRAVAARVKSLRAEPLAAGCSGRVVYAIDMAGAALPGDFVLQLHGTLFSETTLDPGFRRWRRQFPVLASLWRYRARIAAIPIYRGMLQRATSILADSSFIAERLRRAGAEVALRVRTVPLALDPARAELLGSPGGADGQASAGRDRITSAGEYSSERPLRLLTVGRLARIKGHDVVAEALDRLAREDWGAGGVPFAWTVVGPPSWSKRDAPRKLGALRKTPWIRAAGEVGDAALAALYRAHDLLLNVEYNQPAFGLVALEAMTAGCVPAVSDRGALPEVLGEPVLEGGTAGAREANGGRSAAAALGVRWSRRGGGFVVPCGEPRALTALLRDLLERGPAALRPIRDAALSRAAEFSFGRWIDAVESALRAVATGPG